MTSSSDIAEVLARHLSAMNAETLLRRALRDSGVAGERLSPQDVDSVLGRLESGIRLFVEPSQQGRVWNELTALGGTLSAKSCVVPVDAESDISEARTRARSLCERTGAKALVVQRVATIVSELARNIVSYTPGGAVEIAILPSKRVRIVATDRGGGIAVLDEIMAGRYRSKTGLGKGILGVKRLSEKFDVETGPRGTRILSEVPL